MLIDTHCHLDQHASQGQPDELIARAKSAGVAAFVVIGVGGEEALEEALALANERSEIVATAGVHPHDAAKTSERLEARIEEVLARPEVVAVGEVGLDFHYDLSPREQQAEVFRRFIQLAKRVKKPLVLHTRSAPEETLEILESEGARDVGGIIHCFSEDLAFAKRALDLDFDVSFSGIVTFKSAKSVQEVAAWAPSSRILVETDSPYLAPVPLRGKRCEPAFVVHTARRVAELRGVSEQQIAEETTQNACRRLGPALAHAAGLSPLGGAALA
ncbi:MAG: TatD family hydrolase [Polyangiaceae bacterium]|nr:TatD family hydrolase [Polyangiaceae bacterium]MCB9607816.1 TatD family hydrolase [Polyangiaceae bacterium]